MCMCMCMCMHVLSAGISFRHRCSMFYSFLGVIAARGLLQFQVIVSVVLVLDVFSSTNCYISRQPIQCAVPCRDVFV